MLGAATFVQTVHPRLNLNHFILHVEEVVVGGGQIVVVHEGWVDGHHDGRDPGLLEGLGEQTSTPAQSMLRQVHVHEAESKVGTVWKGGGGGGGLVIAEWVWWFFGGFNGC